MGTMTKRERVWAALRGDRLDRPPFVFWHHFRPHGSARALAEATLDFFGRFDLDIYKIMPDLPYPFPRGGITKPDHWHLLAPLAVTAGNFGRQIETVRLVRAGAGPDVPVICTMFSPLTELMEFAGAEGVRAAMDESPSTVHGALAIVTDNLARLAAALIDAGADGIFFSVQGAGDGHFTAAQFAEYGRPYDMAVLSAAAEGRLNVLHAHAAHDLLLAGVIDYPVPVISWSDRLTGISLSRMREAAPSLTLMGGINEHGVIAVGPASAIEAEIADALTQTDNGRRLILAPGCSVSDDNAEEWLRAARAMVAPS
ncbi:MAG: uroporphyrinogen decarboxylase family protein [Chloroflexota bacterium]